MASTPFAPAGTGEAWSVDYLAEVIKFDHGYTAQVGAAGLNWVGHCTFCQGMLPSV